jgi:hypothetical protein
LKIRYSQKYIEEGFDQTINYMELHGCDEGWVVIFDRRTTVNWEDKIFIKKETINNKTITIVGL